MRRESSPERFSRPSAFDTFLPSVSDRRGRYSESGIFPPALVVFPRATSFRETFRDQSCAHFAPNSFVNHCVFLFPDSTPAADLEAVTCQQLQGLFAYLLSALGRNRTCDQKIRSLLLYPLSYEGSGRKARKHKSTAGSTSARGLARSG